MKTEVGILLSNLDEYEAQSISGGVMMSDPIEDEGGGGIGSGMSTAEYLEVGLGALAIGIGIASGPVGWVGEGAVLAIGYLGGASIGAGVHRLLNEDNPKGRNNGR